ncbi:helix-turn-helix domain-containing protein [Streptomyces rishiriensis]|uniref:Transcriptional regulator with XRE-family HTH domain n=1 Tax=Streptomyces rishiriensis TaxID=68264 RepID=A0ABU0NG56_STRRH|nr:helix-turn-helix transcriptional regulator [Streptomyces rishiriensis]MDQ0578074.1 transcriptional regulator with XRE-family HTH domain [Streptomyces rishiriensis]
MNLRQLGEILKAHRERIPPDALGFPLKAGPDRRRVSGLRRDEVARLAGISRDYYSSLEQGRGARPSAATLAGLSRALRLEWAQRAELFDLAGHPLPGGGGLQHVQPGVLFLMDRMSAWPALVFDEAGEVLVQNELAMALLGDLVSGRGARGGIVERFFTDPAFRGRFAQAGHEAVAQFLAAMVRRAQSSWPAEGPAAGAVARLAAASPEFARLWSAAGRLEQAGLTSVEFAHPSLGPITLSCSCMLTPRMRQWLVWFTAAPGSVAADQLALLEVMGIQSMPPSQP